MAIVTANGIDSVLVYGKQSGVGVKALVGVGKDLRRVEGMFATKANKYGSKEIRRSQQQADTRLGSFRSEGSVKGELSSVTYNDFIAALLRKDFIAGPTTTALTTVTAAATTANMGTFTRSTGSYFTDGFRYGMIVRWTGWATTGTPNNARNMVIINLTATVMTCAILDATQTIGPKAAGDSVTCVATGKYTYTPQSGHTRDFFTFEVQDPGITVNRCFLDQLVDKMDVQAKPDGMCEINFSFMGGIEEASTASPFWSAPTAQGSNGIDAGATGLLAVGNATTVACTGLTLNVKAGVAQDPVIGSKYVQGLSRGKVEASGQFTVFLQDSTYLDYFRTETVIPVAYVMSADNTATADAMSFTMGRIKITSADVDDGEKNKIVTCSFDALEFITAGTQYLQTTLMVQDTAAP